jgi:hypothetical protein
MCLCAIGWEVPCTYAQKGPPQAERDAATAGIAGADGAARDAAAAVDVEVLLQRYGAKFSLWFTCEYDDPAGGVSPLRGRRVADPGRLADAAAFLAAVRGWLPEADVAADARRPEVIHIREKSLAGPGPLPLDRKVTVNVDGTVKDLMAAVARETGGAVDVSRGGVIGARPYDAAAPAKAAAADVTVRELLADAFPRNESRLIWTADAVRRDGAVVRSTVTPVAGAAPDPAVVRMERAAAEARRRAAVRVRLRPPAGWVTDAVRRGERPETQPWADGPRVSPVDGVLGDRRNDGAEGGKTFRHTVRRGQYVVVGLDTGEKGKDAATRGTIPLIYYHIRENAGAEEWKVEVTAWESRAAGEEGVADGAACWRVRVVLAGVSAVDVPDGVFDGTFRDLPPRPADVSTGPLTEAEVALSPRVAGARVYRAAYGRADGESHAVVVGVADSAEGLGRAVPLRPAQDWIRDGTPWVFPNTVLPPR